MAVRIGHASIAETGGINGQKGDSTGREVCVTNWYSKPWDFMAVHPDAGVRDRHARAVEAGCANNNIGYGQGDRNTLNAEAKKVGYDLSKITVKCNTDCSEFQNVCAVAAGAPGVTHAANGWTTSSMKSALKSAGYKIITDKSYLTSADYCVRGAIYVKAGSHTVCGLDDGPKAAQTLAKAGLAESNTSYAGKGIGTATAKCDINIRSGEGTGASIYGAIKKGTSVEVLERLLSGWYKIVWPAAPCGYAYTSNADGRYYNYKPKSPAGQVDSAQSFDKTLAGAYAVTSSLHLRAGAGTGKASLTVMPKGAAVQCYGYYTEANGKKWLYVAYGALTGFCSMSYLRR